MTNNELETMRLTLEFKAGRIAGMSPWAAAEEMMAAGMMTAEIASELARRELARSRQADDKPETTTRHGSSRQMTGGEL